MNEISVRKSASTGLAKLVELIFPSSCVHCDANGQLLCEACITSAERLDQSVCRRCAGATFGTNLCELCAASPPLLTALIAIFQYDDAIRDAVHSLKYRDIRAIAPLLGNLMATDPRVQRLEPDVIVPVPLHSRKERRRGYNQSALLAKVIAEELGVPLEPQMLKRIVNNTAQVETKSESVRAENVAGVFEADTPVSGRRILIVDDVTTTGSTLNECARTLLAAGAVRVDAVVFAKEL